MAAGMNGQMGVRRLDRSELHIGIDPLEGSSNERVTFTAPLTVLLPHPHPHPSRNQNTITMSAVVGNHGCCRLLLSYRHLLWIYMSANGDAC